MAHAQEIQPGLLGAFRLYTLIRMVMNSIFIIVVFLNRAMDPGYAIVSIVVGKALLLLYLTLPWFQRRLGSFFLPVGIVLALVDTFLVEVMWQVRLIVLTGVSKLLSSLTHSNTIPILTADLLMSEPTLVAGLFIISWQYRFRWVLIYIVCINYLDLILSPHYNLTDADPISIVVVLLMRSLLFVGIGLFTTQLVDKQRQQRQELAVANQKIAGYAALIEKLAISRERNRLARELHDTLAHTLSAASVQLEAVDSLWDTDQAKSREVLQQALVTTRSGLTETRRALQALRASPLEDLGLLLALRELCDMTRKRTNSAVSVILPDEMQAISTETEMVVYRIAQEALENIVRHAQAHHVELHFQQSDSRVELDIVDDGSGFDVSSVDKDYHFGIRGMFERVEALGGQLRIDSEPGMGTRVKLEMSL